jgi:hypothetical protein
MSKYTDKLAEAFRLAQASLMTEGLTEEFNEELLGNIIVKIAVQRPVKFARATTLAEEAIRRYRIEVGAGS